MKNAVRIGAILASAILLALFVALILRDASAGQYVAVIVMFVFCVLATRLDDITNLNVNATGLQAALERKIAEAQATVHQLQRLAEMFAETAVIQIAMDNRWDGIPSRARREMIGNIERELRAIKIDETRIAQILTPQRTYDRLDYYWWLVRGVPARATAAQAAAAISFQQHFPDVSYNAIPALADVEAYMNRHDLMNGEAAEIFKDWDHYERTFTHRRAERWDKRNDSTL
jgi:hypothetical protein